MTGRPIAAFFLLALLAVPTLSQDRSLPTTTPGATNRSVELRIRVTLSNDHPISKPVRVQLMVSGAPSFDTFTDDRGEANFRVPGGNYRVRVSGQDIEDLTSDMFEVDSLMGIHQEFVRVTLKPEAQAQFSADSSVAVVDINVPRKAQKEFNKGVDSFRKDKLPEAKSRFEAAIALYPQYATAYNYLGVVEIRAGATAPAQTAFEQATTINDKYADALLNLGKIMYQQHKYPETESALLRVISLEPQNALALAMLSHAQLLNGKPDLALANARRAHATGVPHMASAHLIAANVLEARHDMAGALGEYNLYLAEAPNSPAAARIKAGIDRYQKAQMQKPPLPGAKPGGKAATPAVAAPAKTEKPKS